MPRYAYLAQDESGEMISGAMGASSRREALSVLIKRKLTPVQLCEQGVFKSRLRSVKASEIESVFEMLSDLLSSGMPLAKSLDVLCQRTTCAAMRSIVECVRDDVVDGSTLASAMSKHPNVFRPVTVGLIDAGEESGFLERSLTQLAEFMRREQELRGRVVAALAYPLFLLIVGVIVMLGMIIFFVPRFEPLFARMSANGELPIATSTLLAVSDLLRNNIVILASLVSGGLALGLIATSQSSRRDAMENFWRRLPLLGPIFVDLAIARFTRILGTMLQGGVPIVRALEISQHSVGDRRLAQAIMNSSKNVQAGRALTEPLRECGVFPIELTEMISVGEQSNRLEKVLLAMSEKLERKSQRKLDTLVKLIEPCLMVVMACLIGFLIVALLLPVFSSAGRFY